MITPDEGIRIAHMRTLVAHMDASITNYAAGNDAFDRMRDTARVSASAQAVGFNEYMGWTTFQYRVQGETHNVVLDAEGKVVGESVDRRR